MLLVVAVFLPWNVYFGFGVPDGNTWLLGAVVAVTLLSLISIAASLSPSGAKLRLLFNAPYLLLVLVVFAFTVFELVRYGGSGEVPGGVGPGAIAGVGGALLAAQPMLTGTTSDNDRFAPWLRAVRTIGFFAMALALLSVLYIAFWRTHYVIPKFDDPQFGEQNVVVAVTAVIYALVALVVVLVGLRWLPSRQPSALLAAVILGTSTVLGAVLVWVLPVGREIDAFHGIAQATSTAGVGYEGYLAWAIAAAILGPLALRRALTRPLDRQTWQDAARRCLMLIAVYCVGSAVLRITDLVNASLLEMPNSPYDSIALLAFDVVAAAVTVWLRFNVRNPALHPVVISAVSGVLAILVMCRVVVGVGLAQRILYLAPPEGVEAAVYGNTLAQQITSTFDVVLCFVALLVFAAALLVLQRDALRVPEPNKPAKAPAAKAAPPTATPRPPLPPPPALRPSDTGALATRAAPVSTPPPPPPPHTHRLPQAAPRIATPGATSTQRIKIATPNSASTRKLPGAPEQASPPEATQRFPNGPSHTGGGLPPPPQDPPS